MLEVTQFNYIRHEANQKGDSYASIAKRMEIDPRTVKKYANQEEFKHKQVQKRKSPVMEHVKPIIDKCIKEDLKKKFHSFKGSYRTVRDYVTKRKNCMTTLKKLLSNGVIPRDSTSGIWDSVF